jgi:hypothetical protein
VVLTPPVLTGPLTCLVFVAGLFGLFSDFFIAMIGSTFLGLLFQSLDIQM